MDLEVGQKVDIIVEQETTLGYVVLIDDDYEGLLYHSEVFEPLVEGTQKTAYIKNIREDGKIDVSLQPQGYKKVIDIDKEKILHRLKANRGELMITDKSSLESIKFQFQMSKKAFKRALGALYKEKKVLILQDRVQLKK